MNNENVTGAGPVAGGIPGSVSFLNCDFVTEVYT